MNQRSAITPLSLMSALLMSLISFNPDLLSGSRAGPGSPQEQIRIPEISTPRIERMIDVGGRRLHCFVYGSGSPTVVLVSGLEAPQAYWNPVIPDLAARTTIVTYDRAGVGKSEIGGLPTHGARSASDLHVLLDKLAVPRPYILVGHSYGGSIARLFASLYPDDMGGLVLEDTQHEDALIEMRRILTGKDLEAFDQLMADRFSTPAHPKTEADYREMTREQIRKSKPLPRIPYVIMTSAGRAKAMAPLFSDEAIEKLAKLDEILNGRLAALIPGGRLVIVEGTGHDIHMDKPEALVVPVVEMIGQARGRLPISPAWNMQD
jgi:pimeloyl-ACP methyl ester carboxylesterase